MLAPLGEHPFQVYGLFHMWKNGKEQFCNTKGKGGIELPVWGGGIVDIYRVIVLMVSSNVTQVSHRCGGIGRSYEAEKFSIPVYGKMAILAIMSAISA